ncbi:MAG: hypothetical protein GY953_15140, partial [bacterium]|nr:hypothetical protein [bacterium]
GPETFKPYLHPMRAASGTVVTRSYPMAMVEGERQDHPHHTGFWFNHGDVNGLDFWSASGERHGEKHGKIVLTKIDKMTSGKKSGSVAASLEWRDGAGKALLKEERKMTFHAHPTLRIVDFETRLTAAGKVKFGDTKEGSFAIRVAAPLNERHSGTLVNAHGMSGEKNVWGKQSPWMDYSGEIDGEKLGIAIFDHPQNPKHPTYWHVRGYGLFAANVFGEHDFYRDETRDGSVTLADGESMTFRYRVVIHPGDTAGAGVAKLYKDWAK